MGKPRVVDVSSVTRAHQVEKTNRLPHQSLIDSSYEMTQILTVQMAMSIQSSVATPQAIVGSVKQRKIYNEVREKPQRYLSNSALADMTPGSLDELLMVTVRGAWLVDSALMDTTLQSQVKPCEENVSYVIQAEDIGTPSLQKQSSSAPLGTILFNLAEHLQGHAANVLGFTLGRSLAIRRPFKT